MRHTIYRREEFAVAPGLVLARDEDGTVKLGVDPSPEDDGSESERAVWRRLGPEEMRELAAACGRLARAVDRAATPGALQRDVRAWIAAFGEKPFGPAEVALAIGTSRARVGNALAHLLAAGEVRRVARGTYQAPARKARA